MAGLTGAELLFVAFVLGAVVSAIWAVVDQRRYGAGGGVAVFVGIAMFSFFPLSLVGYLIWRAVRAPPDPEPTDARGADRRRGIFQGVVLSVPRAKAAVGTALLGGFLVLIGLAEGSSAEVGGGLVVLGMAVWGRLGTEMIRDHDGERLHGLFLTGLGLLLTSGAALIFIDDAVLELRFGFAFLWFVAPASALAAVLSLGVGLRLVVIPKPHLVRDRRRRRPHRSPLCIPDGESGWILQPVLSMHDPWVLPSHAVERIETVGPPRRGAVRLRAELTEPLPELGPPDWVHDLSVAPDALEFSAKADDVPTLTQLPPGPAPAR